MNSISFYVVKNYLFHNVDLVRSYYRATCTPRQQLIVSMALVQLACMAAVYALFSLICKYRVKKRGLSTLPHQGQSIPKVVTKALWSCDASPVPLDPALQRGVLTDLPKPPEKRIMISHSLDYQFISSHACSDSTVQESTYEKKESVLPSGLLVITIRKEGSTDTHISFFLPEDDLFWQYFDSATVEEINEKKTLSCC